MKKIKLIIGLLFFMMNVCFSQEKEDTTKSKFKVVSMKVELKPRTDTVPVVVIWSDDKGYLRRNDGNVITSGLGSEQIQGYYDTVYSQKVYIKDFDKKIKEIKSDDIFQLMKKEK